MIRALFIEKPNKRLTLSLWLFILMPWSLASAQTPARIQTPTAAPPATSGLVSANLSWCDCLGIECNIDTTENSPQRMERMRGYLARIQQAITRRPDSFLSHNGEQSMANVVRNCFSPTSTDDTRFAYARMRRSDIPFFKYSSYRSFPVDQITIVPREVANSTEGRLPRRPGVRLIEGCNQERILQLRDDLTMPELQNILSHVPLLGGVHFANLLLQQRRASTNAPPDPDAAVAAVILNPNRPRFCPSSDALLSGRSPCQLGLWNFTENGWQAAEVSRNGCSQNTFPQRYLPLSCREMAERRGPRRNGGAVPTLLNPIRTLAEYRLFLDQAAEMERRLKECNDEHNSNDEPEGISSTENTETGTDSTVSTAAGAENGNTNSPSTPSSGPIRTVDAGLAPNSSAAAATQLVPEISNIVMTMTDNRTSEEIAVLQSEGINDEFNFPDLEIPSRPGTPPGTRYRDLEAVLIDRIRNSPNRMTPPENGRHLRSTPPPQEASAGNTLDTSTSSASSTSTILESLIHPIIDPFATDPSTTAVLSQDEDPCEELDQQLGTFINGLRQRMSRDDAVAYENQMMNNTQLPELARVRAHERRNTYLASWTRVSNLSDQDEFQLQIEQLRYCVNHGYCACHTAQLDDSVVLSFYEESGTPAARAEFRELQQRLAAAKVAFLTEHQIRAADPVSLTTAELSAVHELCPLAPLDAVSQNFVTPE